jgi:hypothetical protein
VSKVPTISQVVQRIGSHAAGIEYGRGLRFVKGEVRTRASKGKEFFVPRIFQQKKIVDAFEKEIDKRCHCKGIGKELTKSLGAYETFANPRLTPEMVEQLEKRAAQVERAGPPPKGLKQVFDENDNLKWVGQLSLSGRSHGLKLQMTHWFKEHFKEQRLDKDSTLDPQFLAESNRADLAVDDGMGPVLLRGKERSELEAQILTFVGHDRTAAHNLSALMTQGGIGCAYGIICLQQGWVVGDPSLPKENPNANHYSCVVKRRADGLYHIAQTSQRPINVLTTNAGDANEQNRKLNEHLSKNISVFEFTISHDDLAKGKWGSAKVVGAPHSRFELHPNLAEI